MGSVRGERGDSAVSKNVTALGMIVFCAKEANIVIYCIKHSTLLKSNLECVLKVGW